MKHIIKIVIFSIQLWISPFLMAHYTCSQAPSSTISIASVDNQTVEQDPAQLSCVISEMLYTSGYDHDSSKISIHKSQKHQIAIVETNKGKKFIKIKKRGEGINEYIGMHVFKNFAPIIPIEKVLLSQHLELIISPFNPLAESSLLFHKINALEKEDNGNIWALIQSIFSESFKMSYATMHYSVKNLKNDDFFFNRLKTRNNDAISGRLERIYQEKYFKLINLEISWEELKILYWDIDGVSYQETIEELLTNCRHFLDPNKPRLIGISHGNWQENNIIISETQDAQFPYEYAYFALDFAGENDLIADAIMFLTHTTIYADYLNPIYYRKAYGNHTIDEHILKNTQLMKKREIKVKQIGNHLELDGVGSFGTLSSRKKVAYLFYEQYFNPLAKHATNFFGKNLLSDIDNHTKAALLLRLLVGQDVSKMTPEDQVKMIGLVYKSIGTPTTMPSQATAIHRFLNAL